MISRASSGQSFAHVFGTIHLARSAITAYKEENDSTANPKRSIEGTGVGYFEARLIDRELIKEEKRREVSEEYPARFTNRRSVFRDREKGEIIRHSSKWESFLPEDVGDRYRCPVVNKSRYLSRLQSVGQFNLVPEMSRRVRG